MFQMSRLGVLAAAAFLMSGCGSIFYTGQHPSVSHQLPQTQMREELREQVQTVTVVSDGREPALNIGGDYGEQLPTAGDGAKAGAKAGAQLTGEMIAADPRTLALAPFVLPFAMITGSVTGAAAAKIQQEVQEFREELADELAADDDRPRPGDRLAEELAEHLAAGKNVMPVTEGADAELTLSVTRIDINTYDEDAVIVTAMHATLRDNNTGKVLRERTVEYAERESLRNWTADDNSAWVQYAENARRFLAAEVAADLFERIHVRHVLRPAKTDSFSGDWDASVRSPQPTLAWELFVLGDGPHAEALAKAEIGYELQVFDAGRLVYSVRDISGTSHTLAEPLESCRSLYWTVRPWYRLDGKARAGDWMYMLTGWDKVKGAASTNPANEFPEFWQYFAKLRTRCRS